MYFIEPGPKLVADALEAWGWIGVAGKRPFLVTAFADVFFEASDGVWFLDTLEGELKKMPQTKEELMQLLSTDEGMDLYLFSGFVDRAIREGMALAEGECYDFKINPIVGGPVDYSNIGKMSFLVALHLRGQIHDQVRRMKPGTKISKFVLADASSSKPWWKLW